MRIFLQISHSQEKRNLAPPTHSICLPGPSRSTQFSRALVEFNAPHCLSSLHSESKPSASKGARSFSHSTLASFCSTSVGRFWSKRMEFLRCSASKLCSSRTSSYSLCRCSCNTSAKGRLVPETCGGALMVAPSVALRLQREHQSL